MVAIKYILITLLLIINRLVFSQNYPSFGPEIKVTVNGLNFDAMEPFISPDGNTLFFNSINSADTTNLYYASRIDDSTFNFIGNVGGILDTSANHLDAVPSMDTLSNFFWTSLRDFPAETETIYRGLFTAGNVGNIGKVYGTFNVYQPGWLVFDAAVNLQGDRLYYSNAFFNTGNCGAVPCIAELGIAEKVNDTTFNKLANSDLIFSSINDTNYIVYAPQVTMDGLEVYYTRLLKGTNNTEICVSVRSQVGNVFSAPYVIYSNPGFTPEAATPTTDKQKIYYHQRNNSNVYELFLRYRTVTISIEENLLSQNLTIFPNPSNETINVSFPSSIENYRIEILSLDGKTILKSTKNCTIDISELRAGVYIVALYSGHGQWTQKILKQ